MRSEKEKSDRECSLRKSAVEMLRTKHAESQHLETGDIEKIIYELDVHKAELEIQNEELRRSQMELMDSLNRFEELYDFAPVGYLTLDRNGCILDANLTIAKMVGVERIKLARRYKFSSLVSPQSQDIWHRYRLELIGWSGTKKSCELDLITADRSLLKVSLETISIPSSDGKELRMMMAVIDITERRQAEAQRTIKEHPDSTTEENNNKEG